ETQRYLQMTIEFTWNDAGNPEGGDFPLYSEDEVNNWASLHQQDPNRYPMTDWSDLIINDYAPRSSHSLSFAGGNETLKTRASLNDVKVDAMYDHNDSERIMAQLKNRYLIYEQFSTH